MGIISSWRDIQQEVIQNSFIKALSLLSRGGENIEESKNQINTESSFNNVDKYTAYDEIMMTVDYDFIQNELILETESSEKRAYHAQN